MDHEQKPPTHPRDALFAYYPVDDLRREEEIRLVDLWLVLVRRKAVFFTVAGLILAAGLAYALLAPPNYRYAALLELGAVSTDEGPRSVEGASTALAKINEAFLPAVLTDYLKTQPPGTEPPEIRASNPRGSETTILLSAEGSVDEGQTLMELQASVIARLSQDHAAFTDAERRAIRASITTATNQLEALAASAKALHNQARRTEELAAMLQARRDDIVRYLDEAVALERSLRGAEVATRDTAALLQANVESRALRDQLLQLDEHVAVNLPKELHAIRADIQSNAREMLAQQAQIVDLESRLADIRDTRAVRPPTQSLAKVGPGSAAIVFIAAILGTLLGVISAFMAEYVSKTRSELAGIGPPPLSDPH